MFQHNENKVYISIVVPVLNESGSIEALLTALAPLRRRDCEVILVDGGSEDGTPARARAACDRLLVSPAGRARQMNAGARIARGEILWFLHADSGLPPDADRRIGEVLRRGRRWGGFPVRLSGRQGLLRVVERSMTLRSRVSGILTGDQGLFMTRELFESVGGFARLPLMEDIDLCRRLKRKAGRPGFARTYLCTSSRRWERCGILRTILRMWVLRLAFWLGVPARRLAPFYV
ncbi:MAG TPA: glycosyltransferase [Gammaproteobacteria bacterium]|nr:glycosyltransferase [Gammaproteobacteria bacterium]